MLKVRVYLVDGGVQDLTIDDKIVERHRLLLSNGVSGRALVHALFTDDWGVPPQSVVISGKTADGKSINITLDYPKERSGGRRRY